MHLAVVVPSLTRAGAERVAETLAREFALTAKVTLVTMEPRLGAQELHKVTVLPWADRIPDGCDHVHLPSTGSGLIRLVPLLFRFAALARRERFDAVYSFLTWTNVLVAISKLLGGRYRHIASEHAMAESLRSDGGQLASLARVLPLIYRLPDWIVVVSNAVRNSLLTAGLLPQSHRTVVISNPIDGAEIRRLSQTSPESVRPSSRHHVVLCVARLHVQKDHVTLLRAMPLLPPSFVLYLMGDGSLREELSSVVDGLGLGDRVTFLGAVANPYPQMRLADVVVLPSREEGFGLVAVEAAVLGVPFVGSRAGGLREVCEILGHRTFPVGDHAALAAAIVDAVTSAPVGADERTLSTFDPSRVASMYRDLAGLTKARHAFRATSYRPQ